VEKKIVLAGLLSLGLLCMAAQAGPTYRFTHIIETGDGPVQFGDGAIGEAQLFVELVDLPSGQVEFVFTNTGPLASSMTDVYFDNGPLLGIASITNTPGLVEFSQGASPGNLPGGNNLPDPFVTAPGLSFDSDPPAQPMGVNPGQALGLTFDLQTGRTFQNVIEDLGTGDLRIGLHVQGYASGGSEAFVNNGPNTRVPVPGAALLAGMGIAGLGWLKRRREE